jgi:hypothetical protein
MRWRTKLPSILVCALSVTACADIESVRPRITASKQFAALQYAEVSRVDGLFVALQTGSAPIQTFKPQSSRQANNRVSTYGFAVMIPNRPVNKQLCHAMVGNLSFFSEETRRALQRGDSPVGFRDTVFHDIRSQEELDKIERPPNFSKSDCDELVDHFDYQHAFRLATRLGVKFTSQGPWLIAIDPVDRYAIIYNLAKENDLDRAIDRWTRMLQNVAAWRNRGYGYWDHLLKLFGLGPEVSVVRLPKDFN